MTSTRPWAVFGVALSSLACASSPASPRPEAATAAPVAEPSPAPSEPTFSPTQREQLAQLGALCAAAYHVDSSGAVDQVGCVGTEPQPLPVRAETLKHAFGKSWRGHFTSPTSDEVAVWIDDSVVGLVHEQAGKWQRVVTTRVSASLLDCQVLHAPAEIDLLACIGEFSSVSGQLPSQGKLIRFEPRTTSDGKLTSQPAQSLLEAHSFGHPWAIICDDVAETGPMPSYLLRSLLPVKNEKTGAEDLDMYVERTGWMPKELQALRAKKEFPGYCKQAATGSLAGLPEVPVTPITVRFTRQKDQLVAGPAQAALIAEIDKQMDFSDERNKKRGLSR